MTESDRLTYPELCRLLPGLVSQRSLLKRAARGLFPAAFRATPHSAPTWRRVDVIAFLEAAGASGTPT